MSRKAAIEAFNKNPTLENYNLITGGSDVGINVGDQSLAKGKKLVDKRESIKKKDIERKLKQNY